MLVAGSAAAATAPDLVTSTTAGPPTNEAQPQASLSSSADGARIAFVSSAADLVPGDANGVADVFVRDLAAGTLTRVSVSSSGAEGHRASSNAEISADGRFVVFSSLASNLAPADTNGVLDVFVRDIDGGTTSRISLSKSNLQAVNASGEAPNAISADGQFVTFSSRSANLVSGDTNLSRDVLLVDRSTRVVERVNLSEAGAQAPQGSDSSASAISADGRYVAFVTTAPLVAADTNGVADVYRRDRQTGTTEWVSAGTVASADLLPDGISADGGRVAFRTASALVPSDANGVSDVYVRDLATSATFLASRAPGGDAGNGPSSGGRLSADGHVVAFDSTASNLSPADPAAGSDIFVRDLESGTTRTVSPGNSGGSSSGAAISADAHSLVFTSSAPDIVAGDDGAGWDTFRVDSPLDVPADTTPPSISCETPTGGWHPANVALACTAGDAGSGLADAADAGFSLTTAVADGAETADAATDSRQVCDLAGNCATAGPFTGIAVDRRAPQITISAPAEGQLAIVGDMLTAAYACDDGGSGVASCAGPVASGESFDVDAAGEHTFTVEATDAAGNTSRSSVTWAAELPPLPFRWLVWQRLNGLKAGAVLQVRFLVDGATSDVVAGPVLTGRVACGSDASTQARDQAPAQLGRGPRFLGDGRYKLRWHTRKDWAGSCRQLEVHLTDGSVHRLTVRFRDIPWQRRHHQG
jgi:Tol biopolymer transport system component